MKTRCFSLTDHLVAGRWPSPLPPRPCLLPGGPSRSSQVVCATSIGGDFGDTTSCDFALLQSPHAEPDRSPGPSSLGIRLLSPLHRHHAPASTPGCAEAPLRPIVATRPVPFRPRGFSPPRRLAPLARSWVCCAPLPVLGFDAFQTARSAVHLPKQVTWTQAAFLASRVHTPRRIPLAGSRTASPRPLPSCRYRSSQRASKPEGRIARADLSRVARRRRESDVHPRAQTGGSRPRIGRSRSRTFPASLPEGRGAGVESPAEADLSRTPRRRGALIPGRGRGPRPASLRGSPLPMRAPEGVHHPRPRPCWGSRRMGPQTAGDALVCRSRPPRHRVRAACQPKLVGPPTPSRSSRLRCARLPKQDDRHSRPSHPLVPSHPLDRNRAGRSIRRSSTGPRGCTSLPAWHRGRCRPRPSASCWRSSRLQGFAPPTSP